MWARFEEDARKETWQGIPDASYEVNKSVQSSFAQEKFKDGNCRLLK
jgi:hypothetical protein